MDKFFDTGLFLRSINTQWLGRVLHYREEVKSTNSWAKEYKPGDPSHGALFLADDQQQGRGQYDRKWITQPGQNLTFSLVVCPSSAERLSLLTLSCALAMVELQDSLKIENISSSKIKWPNDVRYYGRKWVGILTETVFSGNKLERVVIGMGVNINQTEFPDEVAQEATSLANITGQTFERELLLAQICERIEYQYRRWHQQDPALPKEINTKLDGVGAWAGIRINGNQLKDPYFIDGVTSNGALKVSDRNGKAHTYSYEQIRIITD